MVEGYEQRTALQIHLVPFAASLLVNFHANPDGGPNQTHLVSRALRGADQAGEGEAGGGGDQGSLEVSQ
jgi:hypothetical protein